MHLLVGYVFPPTRFHFVATHGPIPEMDQLHYDWLIDYQKKKKKKKEANKILLVKKNKKKSRKMPKVQNSTETLQTAAWWRQI